MAKYRVTIEETVSETFKVNAKNIGEAMDLAERKYREGEFVLEPGNLVCTQMSAESADGKESTNWVEIY